MPLSSTPHEGDRLNVSGGRPAREASITCLPALPIAGAENRLRGCPPRGRRVRGR